jgi:hypothetical protein
MDCPFPECGKSNHLYVNARSGKWICHVCGQASHDIKRLLIQVEGYDWLKSGAGLMGMGEAPEPEQEPEPKEPERINTPLPPEYIPVWDGERWSFPKYLTSRNINRKTARRLDLGYCSSGEYANRIILPIRCPLGNSFTSRMVHNYTRIRYKAGEHAGRLLYGWESLRWYRGKVVLVEGPFDAIKVIQSGYAAIALMGKLLSRTKTPLLNSIDRELVVMLDEEAGKESIKVARELGSKIAVAKNDPGDMDKEEIHNAVSGAMNVERFWARYIRSKVRVTD